MTDEQKKTHPSDTFYRPGLLNRWFMGTSVVLAITYVWSVVADYQRPWKKYQRDWQEVEYLTAKAVRDEVWAAEGGKALDRDLEELGEENERARKALEADHHVRPGLEEALKEAEFEFAVTNAAMKKAKSNFEAERFHYEELAYAEGQDLWNPSDPEVREHLERYQELKEEYERLAEEDKAAEAQVNAARASLADHDFNVTRIQKEIDEREREMARLERRMKEVDTDRFFTGFRNSIFFDFMAPTLTVNKIVVKEIHDELNFTKVPKVDMCTTCHLATDRHKDYPYDGPMFYGEDPRYEVEGKGTLVVDKVFQSHPRPELFCTSLSPHPQDRFGCSGCHQGGNQRVSFNAAAHTPGDRDEETHWEEEYGWEEAHYWDYPQLPTQFLEASCYKCHQQQVEIPGAEQWNRGRLLVERYGCYGCHKIAPFDGHRKAGPPLYHMADKFQSVDWTLKWVSQPRDFRPTTRMPQFFHLENRADDPERQQAEITALVTYLYNLTAPAQLEKYPGNGDAARGKLLFGENGGVGCLACHDVDDYALEEVPDRHGPDLSGVGSKLNPDWLYTWIRDPKSLWPDTNMPDLRLTDQEAADLTAYLMTRRNVAFENATFQRPEGDEIYENIVREKLTEQMTAARANQTIAAMSPLDKRLRAGEALLNHYGCFGCHDISGFENAKQIGTELNGWGSKHADRLDFGVVEMDWKHDGKFNRIAWLDQKLRNTRFYDRGKDKSDFEKLKMPQFRFPENADDLRAVMTFVLGLTNDPLAPSIQDRLSPADQAVQRGKQLVREKNCLGCHMMYDEGGELRQFQLAQAPDEDAARSLYPPLLDGQGARTQGDWLFEFLTDPSMGGGPGAKNHLRPWLEARMPTFGFSQEQLNDVIAYFAHEEVWHTCEDQEKWAKAEARVRDAFTGYEPRDLRVGGADKRKLFDTLVARMVRIDGGQFLHATDFPYLSQTEWVLPEPVGAIAQEYFKSLECIQCHMPGGRIPEGKTAADMAPQLDYAKERLQPDWVVHWLEGPLNYQPGTKMPVLWPANPDGTRPTNHARMEQSPLFGEFQQRGYDQSAERQMELIRNYLFSPEFARDYRSMAQ